MSPMEGGGRSSFQPPSTGDRAARQVHYCSAVYRLRGSIYWVLLVSGRFSVSKPLSQIHRSTLCLLQGLSPRPSLGGFGLRLLIIDELGFVPLSKTAAELLFEVFSQRYERGSVLVTTNLPFDEWTEVFGSERLTGALLDRLTHHVHIIEMNGESYRLKESRQMASMLSSD